MTTTVVTKRLPWQDRWNQPSMDELMEPINPQHRRALRTLADRVDDHDHVEQHLEWYGPGWHWTIQFDLKDPNGKQVETLCYLVPRQEAPEVCVPLASTTLERLPLHRLHKFVRNGVRGAKRSVAYHWATWDLTASSEVDQLMDLIKRKHKIVLEPYRAKKKSK